MKTIKNFNDFLNESKSENMDEIYDAIKKHVIGGAISFAFEPGKRVQDGVEGGDLILWNDNKTPTKDDFDKFWEYIKSVSYLYDDWISDEWEGEGDVNADEAIQFFKDNLDGKIKDIFKEEFMSAVGNPKPIKLKGDELLQHILTKYVSKIEDELDIDDFSDEFEYYDNVIYQAVEEYIKSEELDKEYDDEYKDDLTDGLKNYWQPI